MGKSSRRIFQNFILVLGCTLLLAACGPGETVQPSPSGGEELSFFSAGGRTDLDLAIESSAFYDVASELEGGKFLCMQFYQGEPVQFWASAADRAAGTVPVYMYHQDGTKEVCLEGIERFLGQNICFRDSEGYFYSVSRGTDKDSIARLDSTGKTLYTGQMEGHIASGRICEMADGRMAMLVYEGSNVRNFDIALLDADGKLTTVDMSEQLPSNTYLGTSEEDLLMMSGEYLYRVEFPDGKLVRLFSFAQTVYAVNSSLTPCAFRVRQGGKLELLRSDRQGHSGICEILSLTEQDVNRENVVVRGLRVENRYWLKEQALKFNSVNDRYQVVIEGLEQGDDEDAFITRTSVELAAGKGPDILIGNLIESPAELIEKGILMDLKPLLERAEINEEDYFPVAFNKWRMGDSIYCINCSSACMERLMSSAVLGDMGKPTIQDVADALLTYPENGIYERYRYAEDILRDLLEGSETLWGMVDWEKGTCDFDGELFAKLLKVAKRYQYDTRNNYPAISSFRDFGSIYDFYAFPTQEETRAEGYVPLGTLFDDGGHPVSLSAELLSINANAANSEGAWEFLQFLLGEDAQGSMPTSGASYMPVKKSAFWAVAEEEILNGSSTQYGSPRFNGSLSRERAEEIEAQLESVCALPYKTEAILEIILEEAQDYFDGVKEIPQVVDAVENRVGLYLQERR